MDGNAATVQGAGTHRRERLDYASLSWQRRWVGWLVMTPSGKRGSSGPPFPVTLTTTVRCRYHFCHHVLIDQQLRSEAREEEDRGPPMSE